MGNFVKRYIKANVSADVEYVLARFFKKTDAVFQGCITRKRIYQQKQIILNLFKYQDWSVEQAIQVEAHICELLRYYPKGHDTFRQLLVYFDNQKNCYSDLPKFAGHVYSSLC